VNELALALQRSLLESEKIVVEMAKTNIIERSGGQYRLASTVVQDIKSFEPERSQLGFWSNGEG